MSFAFALLSKEEHEAVKSDLLTFIHHVAQGDFTTPEHVSTFIPAVEALARFF